MDEASAREILSGCQRDPGPEAGLLTAEMLERESQDVSASMAAFRRELLRRLDPDGAIWPLPPPVGETETGQNRRRSPAGAGRTVGFSPFSYYPFLFASAFPAVDTERLRLLARANRLLLEAVLVVDSRMDTDQPADPLDLHLLDAHYHRALEILVPVLPPDSEFWPRCRELYIRYGRSVLRELLFHRFRLGPYSVGEFRTISAGKAALLQTTVLALCVWTGSERHRDALAASQEAFLCGFQAIDDLKDWREDYARQNYTYLLTRVLTKGGWVRDVERGCAPRAEDVGRALHFHGSAEEQLDFAEALFQEASEAVASIHVPLWKEVLEAYLSGTRAMKADMAEIRRRERMRLARESAVSPEKALGRLTPLERIERSVKRGVRFLAASQRPEGAFRLAWSPNGYMQPSTILGASRAATELVVRSLPALEEMELEGRALRSSASAWLEGTGILEEGGFGIPIERAFGTSSVEGWVRAAWSYVESGRVENAEFPLPQEALVAEVLYRAAIGKIASPDLDLSRLASVCRGPWECTADPGTVADAVEKRGYLRPLVVSYLFFRALDALGEAGKPSVLETLGDRILVEDPQVVMRTHLTDVALALVCLEIARRPTEILVPLVERLLGGQEADGSWPPNAFYVKGRRCYGSRDVTTAWCCEALALHLKGLREARPASASAQSTRIGPVPVEIELHGDVNPAILPDLKKEAERCALWLPMPEGIRIYVGRWESMASHFVVLQDRQPILALQTAGDGILGSSAGGRPLEAELALGWVEAAWKRSSRPLHKWKERLFVWGLGLLLCRKLWPSQTPWVQAGMSRLEWLWCHENEWFLREGIRRLWYRCGREGDFDPSLKDALPPGFMGLAEKACLYLGLRLFEGACKESGLGRDLRSHLEEGEAEMDRRICSLWGAGRTEKSCRVGECQGEPRRGILRENPYPVLGL